MSSTEILGWMGYFDLHPFRGDQTDYLIALMATFISDFRNVNKDKSVRPFRPSDFLPSYMQSNDGGKASQGKSLEQQEAEFSAFVSKYKEKVTNREPI